MARRQRRRRDPGCDKGEDVSRSRLERYLLNSREGSTSRPSQRHSGARRCSAVCGFTPAVTLLSGLSIASENIQATVWPLNRAAPFESDTRVGLKVGLASEFGMLFFPLLSIFWMQYGGTLDKFGNSEPFSSAVFQ
jgi:hypothetical protein